MVDREDFYSHTRRQKKLTTFFRLVLMLVDAVKRFAGVSNFRTKNWTKTDSH